MSCGVHGMPSTLPTGKGAGGPQHLEGWYVYRDFYFLALVQSVIAKFRGTKHIPVWQRGLAVSRRVTSLCIA